MSPILIIDDQADVRMSAAIALGNQGYSCEEADGPDLALRLIKANSYSLILLDMNYSLDTTSGEEGLRFLKQLKQLKQQQNAPPVVVMTAWASVNVAVQAMQLGAVDFIEKPWVNVRLISIVKQQIKNDQIKKENARFSALAAPVKSSYLAGSQAMCGLLEKAKRAAKSDASILITGENGTGKSLLAEFIHQHSMRSDKRFVSVNMGAIPENLFESELFGHKKGAFTDAKEDRMGRFDMAASGTLFLDEVGTLPHNLQAKMLRVLETGLFEVVGSSQTQQADVRILAATNADLEKAIEKGEFRRDLLFRLNTIELHIPALRERKDEIEVLAKNLLAKHCQKYQRDIMTLSSDALHNMADYHWPGNIRELSHCLERAVIMCDSDMIEVDSLSLNTEKQTGSEQMPLMTLDQLEQKAIIKAIHHFKGNVVEAGEFLGLSKSAIYRRIEKYDLDLKNLDSKNEVSQG